MGRERLPYPREVNPLFPPCPCVELFVCKCLYVMLLVRVRFCTRVGYFCIVVGFVIKLLWLLPFSGLLRLTSLPSVPQPLQNSTPPIWSQQEQVPLV